MAILITAASFSTAYKLEKILHEPVVYFAEEFEMPKVSGKKYVKIPSVSSPSFISEVLILCLDLHIIQIYPLRALEIEELNKASQLFEEYGISIKTPSIDFII